MEINIKIILMKFILNLQVNYKVCFPPFLLEGVALNPNLNLDDGKHPNPKGVKLISKNLEKQLINLLTN